MQIRTLFFLSLFFLTALTQSFAYAVTRDEWLDIERQLNHSFQNELKAIQVDSFLIEPNAEVSDYVGGINLKNKKLIVTVGTQALSDYTLGALKFLVCHELGHFLGGAPFKKAELGSQYEKLNISTEGQSDYWAGKYCLKQVSHQPETDALDFFKFMSLYLFDLVGKNPFYSEPIPGVQDNNYYDGEYPSFQCRYNTVIAGLRGEDRPSCWYREKP